jgi:hypothetical protein
VLQYLHGVLQHPDAVKCTVATPQGVQAPRQACAQYRLPSSLNLQWSP